MKQNLSVLLLALLLVAYFPVPAQAQAELFPSTEVTARYNPLELARMALAKISLVKPEAAEMAMIEELARIEPAAGHGEEPSEGHGSEEKSSESAEEGGHGAPTAHGKTEGEKSFTGKTIGEAPELPKVTIGGETVVTRAQSDASNLQATVPDGLKSPAFTDFMARRFNVTPYAHSPSWGNPHAPVQVLQFVDLSCGQCMPELAKIDAIMAAHASNTYVVNIHAPTMRFQDTNMPAFYGKIAARGGVFWKYRENLVKDNPADANAVFDELVKSGLNTLDIRSMMLTEARRFYRELDADSLLARAFGIGKPPVVFVNGIRLGEGGLPLDKLNDVMDYVNARIARGLPEPPK